MLRYRRLPTSNYIAQSSGRETNLIELLVLGSWGYKNLMGLLICRGTVHRAVFVQGGRRAEKHACGDRGTFPLGCRLSSPQVVRCWGHLFQLVRGCLFSPSSPLLPVLCFRDSPVCINNREELRSSGKPATSAWYKPALSLTRKEPSSNSPCQQERGFFYLRAAELFEISAMFSDTRGEYTFADRKCCLIAQDGSLFFQSVEFQCMWKPEMWLWTHYFDFLLAALT